MQSVGRKYVRVVNKADKRSGTLREGCFKNAAISRDEYPMVSSRYIELNWKREPAVVVDFASDNTYSCLPTSVSGLLKEENTSVQGLQFVSPCRTISKKGHPIRALASVMPMFCCISSLFSGSDINFLS